jgi:glycosyltransferase involved in cell wall biosynthesis
MRICHVTSVHNWDDPRVYHKMCRSLAEFGHDVHLVAANKGSVTPDPTSRVQVHLVDSSNNRAGRMLWTTRAVMNRARELKADIYHFHDPELLPGAAKFQHQVGAPVIYDAHEDYRVHMMAKPWLPRPLHGIAGRAVGFFEDRIAFQLAGVVSATRHIARRFERHSHSIVVHNFPRIDEFGDLDFHTERRVGSFVYLGDIVATRGIHQMISAVCAAGRQARLHLAGRGWWPSTLRDDCSKQPGWAQVVELGYLGRQDVAKTLSKAQAGLAILHPLENYVRSYPVKIFEYMAAALPVIASDFSTWREFLVPNRCGLLLDPFDTGAIAKAMTWIIEHPEEAAAMGKRGRATVLSGYTWQGEAMKLLQLYEDLTSKQTDFDFVSVSRSE